MITIYELLGLVKDGKAPKKIKYINYIWKYNEKTKDYNHDDDLWLFYSMNGIGLTESKVEILEEENKIEKLGDFDLTKYSKNDEDLGLTLNYTGVSNTFNDVYLKINELIDEINKLKEDK